MPVKFTVFRRVQTFAYQLLFLLDSAPCVTRCRIEEQAIDSPPDEFTILTRPNSDNKTIRRIPGDDTDDLASER